MRARSVTQRRSAFEAARQRAGRQLVLTWETRFEQSAPARLRVDTFDRESMVLNRGRRSGLSSASIAKPRFAPTSKRLMVTRRVAGALFCAVVVLSSATNIRAPLPCSLLGGSVANRADCADCNAFEDDLLVQAMRLTALTPALDLVAPRSDCHSRGSALGCIKSSLERLRQPYPSRRLLHRARRQGQEPSPA